MDALKIGVDQHSSKLFLNPDPSFRRHMHHSYRSASSGFNRDADPCRVQSAEQHYEDTDNRGFEQKD